MPVKISPIKILSDLGYEMVDIETDEDYLSALREGINTIEAATKGSGDKRSEALREEFLRVREERKSPNKKVKISQKKISTSKFFDKGGKESPVGTKGGSIVEINNSVTSIVETLKEDQKQDKKQQGWFRKMVERFKRRKKENKLEFRVFDGIKKTASKALEPLKSAWSKLLEFLGRVFLGRVLFKILKWMGNKQNQGKLKSIIKFLKDWWPTMLAAYLLFGTGFTKMVAGLIKVVVWSVGRLSILIPKLTAAIAKLASGKILKGLSGLLGGSGKGKAFTKLFSVGAGAFSGGGLVKEMHYYNEGGKVPGSGNKDTVPAMLTPGEFVMSKGAVQKYGVNTMESMNAAGGGTNRPTMGRYKVGGKVQTMSEELGHTRGTVTDPKEKKAEESYMLKYLNEERALQGLKPKKKLTYAPGVELTKAMGSEYYGGGVKETSNTFTDFDKGIKTKFDTKTRGDESIMRGSIGQTTEEDREKYFAKNPNARFAENLKGQLKLDLLGADISSSAKMAGGGLVQHFKTGGTVYTQEEANAMVDSFDNRPLARIQKLDNERDAMDRGPDGKLSRKDRKRWNEIGDEIDALQKQIIANRKSTTTPKTGGGWFGGLFGGGKKRSGGSSGILGPISSDVGDMVNMDKYEASPKPKAEDRISKGEPIYNKRGRIVGYKDNNKPDLTPVAKNKIKVIDAYNQEKNKMEDKPMVEKSTKEIPKFDALGGRSAQKIKVLGISV